MNECQLEESRKKKFYTGKKTNALGPVVEFIFIGMGSHHILTIYEGSRRAELALSIIFKRSVQTIIKRKLIRKI